MSITYPIDLPPGGTTRAIADSAHVLESPDATKWFVYVGAIASGEDGIIKTEPGGTTATPLRLAAPDGGLWDVTIDNNGILSTTSGAATGKDKIFYSVDTGRKWTLSVDNNGIYQTTATGNAPTAIAQIQWRPRSAVAVSASPFTFQQQVQVHQGMLLAYSARLRPMTRNDAERWVSAILSLNGREGTFRFGDPANPAPRGSAPGSPKVKGGSQTGRTLATDGWTADQSRVLRAGDWIQLGTGLKQRIYKIIKDVDSDASGEATLDIWPSLRESPGDNADIVTDEPKGVFRLADNEMDWSIERALIYGIEFDAVEAL